VSLRLGRSTQIGLNMGNMSDVNFEQRIVSAEEELERIKEEIKKKEQIIEFDSDVFYYRLPELEKIAKRYKYKVVVFELEDEDVYYLIKTRRILILF